MNVHYICETIQSSSDFLWFSETSSLHKPYPTFLLFTEVDFTLNQLNHYFSVVECPSLPTSIKNGRVENCGKEYKETCTFICNENHHIVGETATRKKSVCQHTGKWSLQSIPSCARMYHLKIDLVMHNFGRSYSCILHWICSFLYFPSFWNFTVCVCFILQAVCCEPS